MFRFVVIAILVFVVLPLVYKLTLHIFKKVESEVNAKEKVSDAYQDYENKKEILKSTIELKEAEIEKELAEINKTKENLNEVKK